MSIGVPLPSALRHCAITWSSDGPTGMALNFVEESKLNGSSLFGVTGWHVKYEPTTCVCGSLPWPRTMFCVHSFIERIPRGMSSFLMYGASGWSVGDRSVAAASGPCDILGKNLVVMHP